MTEANAASREARAHSIIANWMGPNGASPFVGHLSVGSGALLELVTAALADEAASQPREGVLDRLRVEIERQCSIGAGMFEIDGGIDQSGLWGINADLDPNGLLAALHDTAPSDQAQGGRTPEPAPQDNAEIVERCARIAEEVAEGSRVLHLAAAKAYDRDGCNIHGEGWRTGLQIAAAIRALATPIQGEI